MSLEVLFVAESLGSGPRRRGALRARAAGGARAPRAPGASALWLQGGADSGAAVHASPEGVEGDAVPAVSRQRATYWRDTRARGAVLSEAVASAPRADVVVMSKLHGAPAAFVAGAPVVLLLPELRVPVQDRPRHRRHRSLRRVRAGLSAAARLRGLSRGARARRPRTCCAARPAPRAGRRARARSHARRLQQRGRCRGARMVRPLRRRHRFRRGSRSCVRAASSGAESSPTTPSWFTVTV